MKKFVRLLLLFAVTSSVSLGYSAAHAAVSLPWSTTFNCSDWTEGASFSCDGMQLQNPTQYCTGSTGTTESVVNSLGNNPAGAGKGFRVSIGSGSSYNNSASPILFFNSSQPELWTRFYVRYASGFKWNPESFHKLLYYRSQSPNLTQVIPEWYGWDGFSLNAQGTTNAHQAECTAGCGWDTVMKNGALDSATGHRTSDGQWHSIQVHLKMDTDGTNGIGEAWIDGIQIIKNTSVNWGTQGGWAWFGVSTNQSAPSSSQCLYVDFDDIAVSNTGYISPLQTAKPSPPQNLTAK